MSEETAKKKKRGHWVNGYQIREALNQTRKELAFYSGEFEGSISKYEDEEAEWDPLELDSKIRHLEMKLAGLQELQNAFNNGKEDRVTKSNLAAHLRELGMLTRAQSRWDTAANKDVIGSKGYFGTRMKDEMVPERVVSRAECRKTARQYEKRASRCRNLIAELNALQIEVPEEIYDWLFEDCFLEDDAEE